MATYQCCICKCTHLLPYLVITIVTLSFLIPHAAPLDFSFQQFLNKEGTLNFEGDVYYDKGFLQLTQYKKDSVGRVTYYKLLHLWDRDSRKLTDFTSNFSFIINQPNKTQIGDGITFFLARPNFPLPVPPDGSGIGLVSSQQMEDPNYPDEHPFVAVEFDTFGNQFDPQYDHVGIDIQTIMSPFTAEWFSIKDGRVHDAQISYNSSTCNLSIIFTGHKDNVTVKQHYSSVVDLREVLPDWVEFGFTSATGLLFEIHTLCSWSFSSSLDLEVHNDKSKTGMVIGLSIGGGVLIVGIGLAWLLMPTIRQAMHVLNFEATLPTLPSKMPKATYVVPSIAASTSSNYPSSSADAFGPTKTEPLSNSSYTCSSESKTSAALLHTVDM
ncbi:Seed lectin [Spatholobus suberectus]|nr:Seed lectin [Spatholobus suberectus]